MGRNNRVDVPSLDITACSARSHGEARLDDAGEPAAATLALEGQPVSLGQALGPRAAMRSARWHPTAGIETPHLDRRVLCLSRLVSHQTPRVENAIIIKALARAFRWLKMLDDGVNATLEDLAQATGVAPSYISRVLRLTLLAPDIVEAILDGRQPAELQPDELLAGLPLEWEGQRSHLAAEWHETAARGKMDRL